MPTVPVAFQDYASAFSQPDPFLWLVEVRSEENVGLIDPDDTGGDPVILRMTPNSENVEFGTSTTGAPIVWDSYPLEIGAVEKNSEGDLGGIQLTLSNALGQGWRTLEANDFCRGSKVYIHLVHSLLLADPEAKMTLSSSVVDVDTDVRNITVQLSAANLLAFDFPQEIIGPDCRFTYRGIGCFFNGDPANTLGLCTQKLTACEARGDWEDANGLAREHPKNFGGVQAGRGAITV